MRFCERSEVVWEDQKSPAAPGAVCTTDSATESSCKRATLLITDRCLLDVRELTINVKTRVDELRQGIKSGSTAAQGGYMGKSVELYVTASCPYSEAAREDLEWRGVDFVEYDVEKDSEARERMLDLTGGTRTVPIIVEEGKPPQIGWMGRGCTV